MLHLEKIELATLTSPRKKRPKHAGAEGTPRQRATLLGIALLCLVVALLIPVSKPDPELQAPSEAVMQPAPAPVVVAVQSPAPPLMPLAHFSNSSLPALQEFDFRGVHSPDEVERALARLLPYQSGSRQESDSAYKMMLTIGESLKAKLPKLIEGALPAELYNLARAARELKAVEAAPALIARMTSGDISTIPQQALLEAVASFQTPVSDAFVMEALKGTTQLRRDFIWEALGENMSAVQVDLAFQIVSEGKPDWPLAARALGRHGRTFEKAQLLLPRIQRVIGESTGDARLALIQALCGMEPLSSGSLLLGQSHEFDARIKAAALAGLARSPQYRTFALDALRSSNDPTVRGTIANALAENTSEESLDLFVDFLNDNQLRTLAHRTLVVANKGRDLGKGQFIWRDWLNHRKSLKRAGGQNPVPASELKYETEIAALQKAK